MGKTIYSLNSWKIRSAFEFSNYSAKWATKNRISVSLSQKAKRSRSSWKVQHTLIARQVHVSRIKKRTTLDLLAARVRCVTQSNREAEHSQQTFQLHIAWGALLIMQQVTLCLRKKKCMALLWTSAQLTPRVELTSSAKLAHSKRIVKKLKEVTETAAIWKIKKKKKRVKKEDDEEEDCLVGWLVS